MDKKNPLTKDDPVFSRVMSLSLKPALERLTKLRFPMPNCDPDYIETESCGVCQACHFIESMGLLMAMGNYRWYLDLRARHPDETLVPFNDRVEAFWEQHAADAAAYEADCRALFGKALPRDLPARGTDERRRAGERTRELFLATYPQPRDPFDESKPSPEPWPPKDMDFGLTT